MKPRIAVSITMDVETGEALIDAATKQRLSIAEYTRQVIRAHIAQTQRVAAQAASQRTGPSGTKSLE